MRAATYTAPAHRLAEGSRPLYPTQDTGPLSKPKRREQMPWFAGPRGKAKRSIGRRVEFGESLDQSLYCHSSRKGLTWLWVVGLASPKSMGQISRLNTVARSRCCSLRAEFLLWGSSVFTSKAFD